MKKMFIKKSGFTLAEILLALAIIGIVFGISVPALQNSTATRERDSQLMKLYPILDNTINWIVLEHVDVESVPWGQRDVNGSDKFSQYLAKKLRVGQDCQNGTVEKDACWAQGSFDVGGKSYNFNGNSAFYKVDLVDGSAFAIRTYGSGTDNDENIINPEKREACTGVIKIDGNTYKHVCAEIYVDINGVDPPNKWGRDMFAFVYTKYNEDDRREAENKRNPYVYGLRAASAEAISIIEKPKESGYENGGKNKDK